MNLVYVTTLLCVVVVQHKCAFRISYRFTKMNHRKECSMPYRKFGVTRVTTVSNASLERCLELCIVRLDCSGVNYSRMRTFCEVLSNDIYNYMFFNIYVRISFKQQISYVFINRTDMELTPDINCTDDVSCTAVEAAITKECDPAFVRDANILGNFLTIGSKVKVDCDHHYTLEGNATLICQPDKTWSRIPMCIWDCGEPNLNVKGNVNAGLTTTGSVRTYTCHDEFFMSGNRKRTSINVTCSRYFNIRKDLARTYIPAWMPIPRCVQDCDEPGNVSRYNTQRVAGNGNQDHAFYDDYCPNGSVSFSPYSRPRVNKTAYVGNVTNLAYIRVYCDGTFPRWGTSYTCVKNCTESPSINNVKKVMYFANKDDLKATYQCRPKHYVYDGTTDLNLDTFITHCKQPNTSWTNRTLICVKDVSKTCKNETTNG